MTRQYQQPQTSAQATGQQSQGQQSQGQQSQGQQSQMPGQQRYAGIQSSQRSGQQVGQQAGRQAQFGGASQQGGIGQQSDIGQRGGAGQQGAMAQQAEGTQQAEMGGQVGEKFEDHLSSELKLCLDDCLEVEQVAEWCADACIEQGPQMADCARACEDVADVAHVLANFISRDAAGTPHVAQALLSVGEEALAELRRHQAPHVQETAKTLDRTLDSTYQAIQTLNQQGTSQQGTGQQGVGQQGTDFQTSY